MSDATRQPCFYLPISRGQPPSPQQAPTAEAPELNSFGPERPIGVPCSKAMRGLAPAFLACPNGARRCIPIGQSGGEVISSWPACDSPMLLCSRTTSEFPGPSQASVGRVCPLFWGPRAWAEMSSGLGLSLWCRGKDHDLSAHTPLGDGVLTGAARLHINKLKAKPKRSSAEDTDHGARGIAHSFPILALKRSAFLLEVLVVRQSAIGPHFAVAPPPGILDLHYRPRPTELRDSRTPSTAVLWARSSLFVPRVSSLVFCFSSRRPLVSFGCLGSPVGLLSVLMCVCVHTRGLSPC